MTATLLHLPLELRDIIYDELLTTSSPISLFLADDRLTKAHTPSSQPLRLHPNILLTNRQLHHEASRALYSRNRFQLRDYTTRSPHGAVLRAFVAHIGLLSSRLVRHLSISFPRIRRCWGGELVVDDDALETIRWIRDRCGCLARIEMVLDSEDTKAKLVGAVASANDVLVVIDALFKSIASLQSIRVKMTGESSSSSLSAVKSWLRLQGWTVQAMRTRYSYYDEYYLW